MKKNLAYIFVLALVFALLDQLSKYFLVKFYIVPLVFNAGIVFGLPVDAEIMIVFTIIFIPILLYVAAKELRLNHPISLLSLSLIVGGGVGNLIDRIRLGHVIDFISVWKWPKFNLADAFLTIGVLLLFIFYVKIRKVKTKQ